MNARRHFRRAPFTSISSLRPTKLGVSVLLARTSRGCGRSSRNSIHRTFSAQMSRSSRRWSLCRPVPPDLLAVQLDVVEGGIAEAVLAAQLLHRHAGLCFLQKPDDLLLGKNASSSPPP